MSAPDFDEYYGDLLVWIETVEIDNHPEGLDHPSFIMVGKVLRSKKDRLPKDFPVRIALALDPGEKGLTLTEQGGFARWPTTAEEAQNIFRLIKLDAQWSTGLGADLSVADAEKLAPTLQEQHLYDLTVCLANLIRPADQMI